MSSCVSPVPISLCVPKSRIQHDPAEANGSASEAVKQARISSGQVAVAPHLDLCGMERGWVMRGLPASTLIPYCSNAVAKTRPSCTRRASAGASSLGHRTCRMWEACAKLPFIHDLRGRRTGRSSANGAPATSYRPLKWPKDFSVTPSIPTFFSIVGSGPYNLR